MPCFTILLALFAGIGDPFLALTLKKPKENQCFWLRTLKNLRKTFVFVFPRASGDPGGTIGPTTPKKIYITNSRSTAQAAVMLNRLLDITQLFLKVGRLKVGLLKSMSDLLFFHVVFVFQFFL